MHRSVNREGVWGQIFILDNSGLLTNIHLVDIVYSVYLVYLVCLVRLVLLFIMESA